ncbi:hypothetical protein Fmac_017543 [Flemingia macrophylla]|uniref:Uncharacterized protein n=1 Tax=Flemingia macrophylla TaxID=520843 RepID=A0ABD1M2E6_9FABA
MSNPLCGSYYRQSLLEEPAFHGNQCNKTVYIINRAGIHQYAEESSTRENIEF